MEKNSMGSFIAALRKANGLTQKELAEKLNVSDKAVSRWERDESCPDLMLIPLIADTFGITSDELLRGERNKTDVENSSAKASSKKVDIILKRLTSKFNNQTMLSLGIAIAGLVVTRAVSDVFIMWIPFVIAVLCFIASFVCQTVFKNSALSAVSTDEFEDADLVGFCQHIKNRTWLIYGLIASFIPACCALINGLGDLFWVPAAIVAAVFLILLTVNSIVVLKSKKLFFDPKQKRCAKLKLKLTTVFLIIAAITTALLFFINDYSTVIFADGITLDNGKEAAACFGISELKKMSDDEIIKSINSGELFIDHPSLFDTYSIEQSSGGFPVKVYTKSDIEKAREAFDSIIPLFIALFCAEAVAPFTIYFVKKKKYR